MADLFTDDGGSNTAPYETWAKAATAFLTAVDASSGGDRLIIGHDHTETLSANTFYAFSTDSANPNIVISALSSAGGSTVTYTKATAMQIDGGGGSTHDLEFDGYARIYGVFWNAGDNIQLMGQDTDILFEDCELELDDTNCKFWFGDPGGQNFVRLKDTKVHFSDTTNAVAGFYPRDCAFIEMEGGEILMAATSSVAWADGAENNYYGRYSGVDMSSINTPFFDVSDIVLFDIEMHHCILHASASLTTGTMHESANRFLMTGCDDTTGNDLERLEYIDFWGTTLSETAIYRNSGASDGTIPLSWKMISTADASEFTHPTKSPRIYSWVDATGSTTFTVNINWDSASDLQDDEVWLEIEFLEASADTDSAYADDRMANITSTPVDQTNNALTWTGTSGFSNENQQEVAVTVTVNRVGPVTARVCLAKPSTTIYTDPKIVKS